MKAARTRRQECLRYDRVSGAKGLLPGANLIASLRVMDNPAKMTPPANNPGTTTNHPAPSPALLFDTINAYQRTATIKAAIELDVFTAMAGAPATAEIIATHSHASPRGIRILCDYLTILGFLTKSGDRYASTPDSALFLNRKSPAYAGGTRSRRRCR